MTSRVLVEVCPACTVQETAGLNHHIITEIPTGHSVFEFLTAISDLTMPIMRSVLSVESGK